MSLPSTSLVPTWKESVGPDFEELFIRASYEAYHDAHSTCLALNLSPFEIRYLRPQIRCYLMEKALREVSAQLHLRSAAESNDQHTHHHRRVKAGLVSFTTSAVSQRDEMPRYADFRKSLAESPQKVLLFEDDKAEPTSPATELFAILTHAERLGRPWMPEFIDVLFPVSATEAAEPRVRLFEVHHDLVASIEGHQTDAFEVEVEEIAPPQMPEFLPSVPKTGTESK